MVADFYCPKTIFFPQYLYSSYHIGTCSARTAFGPPGLLVKAPNSVFLVSLLPIVISRPADAEITAGFS